MEFVVNVMKRFLKKNMEDEKRIMMNVKNNGVGECGVLN